MYRPFIGPVDRLATSVVKPETQVVTHLCYSDFEDILPAIDGLKGDHLLHTILT